MIKNVTWAKPRVSERGKLFPLFSVIPSSYLYAWLLSNNNRILRSVYSFYSRFDLTSRSELYPWSLKIASKNSDINESQQFRIRLFVSFAIRSCVARKGRRKKRANRKRRCGWNRAPGVREISCPLGLGKENGLKRIKRDTTDSHFPSKYRQLCQQAVALMLVKCLTTFTQRCNKRRTGRLVASAIMQRKATAVKKKKKKERKKEKKQRHCRSFALESDRFAFPWA